MKIFFFSLCFFVCTALWAILIADATYAQQPQSAVIAPSYSLQIMTILEKFKADEELQKVRKRGYDAYLSEYTTETGKVIYKLRSGKYASHAAAAVAARDYENKEGRAVMVVAAHEDARADEAPPAHKASVPDTADEKKDAGKQTVRVTVQDAKKTSDPSSLQQKIAALKRGEMPAQKKKTAMQQPDDSLWFTLQTNTEPDKRSAERRINRWREKGYEAYCVEAPMQNGKTLFKIRIGKYGSQKEASLAAEQFNTHERRGCMVVKITPAGDIESDTAAGKSKPVPIEQAQDEPDEIEPTVPPQKVKRSAQTTVAPDGEAQMPTAEMPSEPEPLQPTAKPSQKAADREVREQPDSADNDSQLAQPVDAPAAVDAPERMTKIYAYRETSGALNLTNRYEDIPEAVRKNVEYISLFPVRIKEFAKNGHRLTLEVEGKQTDIILAGLTMPKQSEPARGYLEALKTKPLRLKYNPWRTTKDGAIAGRLFLKEGSYINLDMVRKGLGEFSAETLALDQQEAFRRAQDAAKRERLGMWAN